MCISIAVKSCHHFSLPGGWEAIPSEQSKVVAGRGQDVLTVDARSWPGRSRNPRRVCVGRDLKDSHSIPFSSTLGCREGAQRVLQECHTMDQSLGMGPKLLLTSEAAEFPFPNYNGNSKN